MSDNVSFSTGNEAAFMASFLQLGQSITNTALRGALNQSLKGTTDAYATNLRSHIGTIPAVRRNKDGSYSPRPRLSEVAAQKVWRFPDGQGYAGFVGPQAGQARHAHLIENGTVFRVRKKIGGKFYKVELRIQKTTDKTGGYRANWRQTGTMPAFGPLEKAVQSTKDSAQNTFIEEYARRVVGKGL